MIHDEEWAHFLAELNDDYYHDPLHFLLDFDELNWHLVMTGTEIAGERGAESVHQSVDGDAKANFSFFATITAEERNSPSSSLRKTKLVDVISNSGNTMHTILRFGIRLWDGPLNH
jgi:hypothetical protein